MRNVGKHPVLLNVTYIRGDKKKGIDECFEVIYKDDNNQVHWMEEPPLADIYIVKPEFRTYTYNKPEERMERMEKVTVPISQIKFRIAEEMGEAGKALVQQAFENHDFKALNQLYKWPYCYGADFQPEYYYYKNWYEKYPMPVDPKLSKGWLDIETDLMDYTINVDDIPNTAYAPINVVSIILEETKEAWQFVLRPYVPPRMGRSEAEYQKRYALYEKQKKAHDKIFKDPTIYEENLNQRFDKVYGHLDYHIREYEHEIDLIADLFRLIHLRKPNFCTQWNMRFDINYILHRCIALGYNPKSIMCHPDFPVEKQRCYFSVDKTTYKLEKQFDYFYCSSYTIFNCALRNYASIRKSEHALPSFRLNDVADWELGDHKVEYPEETNMRYFPYEDWLRFLIYNMKDSLLTCGIERRTRDIETIFKRSHSNLTPYNKIFRETHLLRNVREKYFEKQGWVQSNNVNILNMRDSESKAFYEDDDEDEYSFKGAIMADPKWNDYVGQNVLGFPSNNVHQNSMDFDMGAFYPSIKIASNMDPITLRFKASFDNYDFISGQYTNRSLNDKYEEVDKFNHIRKIDITGEAVNTYVSGNDLTFAYNYLNLPSITKMADIVVKELKQRKAA